MRGFRWPSKYIPPILHPGIDLACAITPRKLCRSNMSRVWRSHHSSSTTACEIVNIAKRSSQVIQEARNHNAGILRGIIPISILDILINSD